MRVVCLALLVAACTQDDPCDGVSGTCVTLHVTSPETKRIDALSVDLLAGDFHATSTTQSSSDESLPVETALQLALPGDLDLGIVAAGTLNGSVLGTGSARLAVQSGQHITAKLDLVAAEACNDGALYCGGNSLAGSTDTLYRCHDNGVPEARGVCAGGCLIRPAASGDTCKAVGGTCIETGFYCGGDKVDGDPSSLYRCTSGTGTFVMECPNGCVIGSPGHDDACR
jgi:hypothetical protein